MGCRYFNRFVITNCCETFSFAFETTDLNSLLNFEYSLLNDKGELLQFADREDKVPVLKFIIQII